MDDLGCLHMLCSKTNVPSCFATTCKNTQLLGNVIFYKHEWVNERLHVKWCRLRKCPDERRIHHSIFESHWKGACTNITARWEPMIDEHRGKHVIHALQFLALRMITRRGQPTCWFPSSFKPSILSNDTQRLALNGSSHDLGAASFFRGQC